MEAFQLTAEQLDAFKEIGNISAGNAATAFSQLVGRYVGMEVPDVRVVPVSRLGSVMDPDALRIGFYQRVVGEASGHVLVMLTKASAFELVHLALGDPIVAGRFLTPRDEDCLKELANIVVGSYLTTLSKITGFLFMPSVPVLTVDLVHSMVSYILNQHPEVEFAFILAHQLRIAGTDVMLQFVLLPHPDSLPMILKAVPAILQ